VAHHARGAVLLTSLALAWVPQTLRAQADPLILDNFTTGKGKLDATSGSYGTHPTVTLKGSEIYGGARELGIWFSSNEFGQTVQAQVLPQPKSSTTPSALITSAGFNALPAIQLTYEGLTPLSLNLNMAPYNRFQLTFAGLTAQVDFVVEVWDDTGNYSEIACDIGPFKSSTAYTDQVTTVDFPTASFGPTLVGPVDWSHIQAVLFEWQIANNYGMGNSAITNFSALTSLDPPGNFTCPPGGSN
jgi:hypothetical protein